MSGLSPVIRWTTAGICATYRPHSHSMKHKTAMLAAGAGIGRLLFALVLLPTSSGRSQPTRLPLPEIGVPGSTRQSEISHPYLCVVETPALCFQEAGCRNPAPRSVLIHPPGAAGALHGAAGRAPADVLLPPGSSRTLTTTSRSAAMVLLAPGALPLAQPPQSSASSIRD